MNRRNFLILSEAALLKFSGLSIPLDIEEISSRYGETTLEEYSDACFASKIDVVFKFKRGLVFQLVSHPLVRELDKSIRSKTINDFVDNYFSENPRHLSNKAIQWSTTVQQQMSKRPPEEIIDKLKACRAPCLISTPLQYRNLQIVPLLTAWDFYEEERRLRNHVIRDISSCLSGDYYIYSIRNRNNVSLCYFDIKEDISNKVYTISGHSGKDFAEPDKKCIDVADKFIAYLNAMIDASKIVQKKQISDSKEVILASLKKERDDSEEALFTAIFYMKECCDLNDGQTNTVISKLKEYHDHMKAESEYNRFLEKCYGLNNIPEDIFKSTNGFKYDALREVMGKETIETLINRAILTMSETTCPPGVK